MRLKMQLLRVAARKQKNPHSLTTVTSVNDLNVPIDSTYRNRKNFQLYEDELLGSVGVTM